jgi:hypothetical protein
MIHDSTVSKVQVPAVETIGPTFEALVPCYIESRQLVLENRLAAPAVLAGAELVMHGLFEASPAGCARLRRWRAR